jgi:MoaA/NifB/PqqE/SkfB family radical SAM enzyme
MITPKVAKRFARNLILTDRPFFAHLFLTKRCNLRCSYCGVWRAHPPSELSTHGFFRIIDRLDGLGVAQISFTGGEPLLRRDCFEIIEYAVRKGLWTQITSNGTLPLSRYARLVKTGINLISISLDSTRKEVHESQRGKGFDEVMRTIRFLSRNRRGGQIINISTIVTERNLSQLPELVTLSRRLGICLFISPAMFAHGPGYGFRPVGRLGLSADEVNRIYGRLVWDFFRSKLLTPLHYLRVSQSYLKTQLHRWDCRAGRLFFAIMPDGRFDICQDRTTSKNVLDEDFVQWWMSDKFETFRRKLVRKCEGCVYSCYFCTQNLFGPHLADTLLTFMKNFLIDRL